MASKRDDVYTRLLGAILHGDLLPGEPISERAVAESLGASRVPLREALIQLQRDGLITNVPRRGAFVRTFSSQELEQLYELRGALEGLAAARAALLLPRGALTAFRRSFSKALRSRVLDAQAAEQLGVAFHEKILEGCGNPLVTETAAKIRDQVQLAKRMSYDRASAEWVLRGAREHLDIAEAITVGDSAEAERQMKAHIAAWSRHFSEQLGDRGGADRLTSTG